MVTAGQRAGLVGETSMCHRIETANVDTAKNPMLRIASGVPWSDPLLELLPRRFGIWASPTGYSLSLSTWLSYGHGSSLQTQPLSLADLQLGRPSCRLMQFAALLSQKPFFHRLHARSSSARSL